jgi:hypothetical protein
MAKKSKTRKRRARRAMSAPARRRTMRKRRGLSELFNATTAQAAAKSVASGAVGGVLAGGLLRLMKNRPTYERLTAGLAASFVTYAVVGMPNMAAGMAGAIAATESAPLYDKFMSESLVDYADVDALNTMPAQVMSEDGEVLTLAEVGGEMVYLNESEQVMLAETAYLQEGIYPDYSVQY